MTPQEALELLNNVEFASKYQGKDEYGTMLVLCKDSLEKQIPKKVKHKQYSLGRYTAAVCPTCDGMLGLYHFAERSYKCCCECGQALDWSDNNGE